ncbi:MAG: DPP IV N-terminal domain-containing protein, partial [Isosphaeraceae bacterium]
SRRPDPLTKVTSLMTPPLIVIVRSPLLSRGVAAMALVLVLTTSASAQDRLKAMPGYERHQKMSREINGSYKSGSLAVTWAEDGESFDYRKDGKSYRFDVAARKAEEVKPGSRDGGPASTNGRQGRGRVGGVERGRQFGSSVSPDGLLKAFHRDRNLFLSDARGVVSDPVTTDGDAKTRVKNGVASWVYGEELDQNTAIWWSPDSKKVAFYRFDESGVRDYHLQLDQTRLMSSVDSEPYPKSGSPNPIVELLVYDVESKKVTKVDARDGKPFTDDVVGHYVYNVRWTPDGKELLFHRTNRRQNVLELTAANPSTGVCRVVVREEWPASWVENNPPMRFLKDGKRFLWTSERNGFKNLYLYDLSGTLLATVTNHSFEAGPIVRVDEEAGVVDYMARSGDNPIKAQLHRVGLDGSNDRRLTDPSLHHAVDGAPDGKHFIDVAQTHDVPPVTRLVTETGEIVEELAHSDLSKFESLGLHRVELLTFKAADGQTDLYGMLHKPSDFDPEKTYPLLVSVYAGPATNAARETFTLPSALTEYGFLIASFDSRSAAGRGKKFLDAIYENLGTVEIDDQAAGVKSLYDRPYLDKDRVGIFGTSYGGYASIMALLRHPEVFQAASASSPVTDWKHYDTIYTERYMWTPQGNEKGYKAGSALTYVDKLQGRLMLFYGTADNNVHPSNTMELVQALQRAGKSFELQVGPDLGHSGLRPDRMMEFFIERLVMETP